MTKFLLIHGSCHGAWCWDEVIAELSVLGHDARAIDLPGAGADVTPLTEVTLASYADAILDALADDPGPTVVVGHSAGGFAITEAAERDPTNFARLIYLCAYVPVSGQGVVQMRKSGPRDLLAGAFELAGDRRAFRFTQEALRDNVYDGAPDRLLDKALERLSWQPLKPQTTPVTETGRSAHVPRSAVVCSHDRVIPPEHQQSMAEAFGPENIHPIPTGHAPMAVAPAVLAEMLARISADVPPSA